MAGAITSEVLESWKVLLREGRVQECDNQINAAEEGLKRSELEAQMKKPAGEPMTERELISAFYTEIVSFLGNPPRLLSLLVEIRGRAEKRDD